MVEPDAGFSLYNSGRQLLLENEGPPLPAHVQAGLAGATEEIENCVFAAASAVAVDAWCVCFLVCP